MREIKDNQPIKGSVEYRQSGPPAPADKVSPLRGLKQRWTARDGLSTHRTRAAAIRQRTTNDTNGVKRVFV